MTFFIGTALQNRLTKSLVDVLFSVEHVHVIDNAFSRRIINTWNDLHQIILACNLINSCNNRIDKYTNGWGVHISHRDFLLPC